LFELLRYYRDNEPIHYAAPSISTKGNSEGGGEQPTRNIQPVLQIADRDLSKERDALPVDAMGLRVTLLYGEYSPLLLGVKEEEAEATCEPASTASTASTSSPPTCSSSSSSSGGGGGSSASVEDEVEDIVRSGEYIRCVVSCFPLFCVVLCCVVLCCVVLCCVVLCCVVLCCVVLCCVVLCCVVLCCIGGCVSLFFLGFNCC
jgi:hypothetical protein